MQKMRAVHLPCVLELGVYRSIPGRSTLHREFVPHAGKFLGTDITAGADVDFVADLHRLTEVTGIEVFDAVISCSTFEHLKYPHKAAHEIMKSLKVGGALFIQTHQTFHLHSYPHDYFRFSREALAGLFGTRMGFNVIATDYEFPVKLISREIPVAANFDAYLNVRLFGEKVAPTPETYVHEYDVTLAS